MPYLLRTYILQWFSLYTGDSGIGFLFVRIAAGITTGTLAIFSAQPTDVVKVRMQAEVKKQGEKSQYKGVIDAYRTIAKTEGMKGLYKGIKICGIDEWFLDIILRLIIVNIVYW